MQAKERRIDGPYMYVLGYIVNEMNENENE